MGNSASALTAFVGFLLVEAFNSLMHIFVQEPAHANNTLQDIERVHAEELQQAREREADLRNREAAAKGREADALADAENAKNEVQRLNADLEKAREREVDLQNREEDARADAEKAKNDLQRGIRPIVMPNKEQVQAAKDRIQYSEDKLHFAVCGTSGSGKSSLINAFRGLVNREEGAAAVGVTETTSEVTRYPDPRGQLPYSRFVWYDIPGAGTTNVPDWQYFNDQGLFVFDFIVLVYDTRFTSIDVGIIENCFRFNKTVFIVRSKADQHINNMMQEEGIEAPGGDDDYKRTQTEYVEATTSNFASHMQTMSENSKADERDRKIILSQRVYIVSAKNVRTLLRNYGRGPDRRELIDEVLLIQDMLRTAARERYTTASGEGSSGERQEGNN